MSSQLILAGFVYVIMALSNAYNAAPNIEKMSKNKVFDNLVVGDGPEIYFYDYMMDYFNRVNALGDPEISDKVRRMIHKEIGRAHV